MAPTDCPHLILQAMAGPLAAATASTVTNPMDVVRARVQVSHEQAALPGRLPLSGQRLQQQADYFSSKRD